MTSPENPKSVSIWQINGGVQGFDLNSLPRCSAITKITKRRCRNPAMKGREVCCVHAGIYKPGAALGNTNSLKHGLFSAEKKAERQSARDFIEEAEDFLRAMA